MEIRSLGTLALLGAVAAGCGSSSSGGDGTPEQVTVVDAYDGGPGMQAPATSTASYPAGPYGVRVGSTIADASFLGYASATERTLKLISFHDYYDPDGSKGIKLLYFSAGAIWCPPCNTEAADFSVTSSDGGLAGARDLSARLGVQFIEDLTAGARQDSAFPATEADLNSWLNKHKLPFPVFLDPARKLEIYFDANGIPYGMLIDPRTMKILKTTDGWFGDSTAQARLKSFEEEITPFLAK